MIRSCCLFLLWFLVSPADASSGPACNPPVDRSPIALVPGDHERSTFDLRPSAVPRGGGNDNATTVLQLYEHELYDPRTSTWIPPPPPPPLPLEELEWQSMHASSTRSSIHRFALDPDGTIPAPLPTDRGYSRATPNHMIPPEGYEFDSAWKIDVGGSGSDDFGWEYAWVAEGGGIGRRRRRWLRSLRMKKDSFTKVEEVDGGVAVQQQQSISSTATAASVPSKAKKRRRKSKVSRFIRSASDNYNFKGFGWSFYKSLFFPTSCGIAFRLPGTINFDWYERRPALPSISSSAGLYYPWMAGVFVSMSLPMELLRFWFAEVGCKVQFVMAVCWVLVRVAVAKLVWAVTLPVRILLLVPRALLVPLLGGGGSKLTEEAASSEERREDKDTKFDDIDNGEMNEDSNNDESLSPVAVRGGSDEKGNDNNRIRFLGHDLPPFSTGKASIIYSTNVVERVGMSVSWRVSEARGYEFRVSYWYLYLPTLLYLGQVAQRVWEVVNLRSRARRKRRRELGGPDDEPLSLLQDDAAAAVEADAPPWKDWLRRKFGSLGLTMSAPILDPPYYSLSACMSLSGFYYGKLLRRVLTRTTELTPLTKEEEDVAELALPSSSMVRDTSVAMMERDATDVPEVEFPFAASVALGEPPATETVSEREGDARMEKEEDEKEEAIEEEEEEEGEEEEEEEEREPLVVEESVAENDKISSDGMEDDEIHGSSSEEEEEGGVATAVGS